MILNYLPCLNEFIIIQTNIIMYNFNFNINVIQMKNVMNVVLTQNITSQNVT